MGDYFNNLLVRSFNPVTAVQPLDSWPGETLDRLAPPTLEEVTDPFADPTASADEPGQPRPYSPHPPHGERAVTVDETPGETLPVVSSHSVTTVPHAAESKIEPQPAAPRSRYASEDKPSPSSKPPAPPNPGGPTTGDALRTFAEGPRKPLKPTLAATAEKAKSKEPLASAASEATRRVSAPRRGASAERTDATPRKKNSAAEKVSHENPPRPSPAESLWPAEPERSPTIIERIVEPLEKDQATSAPLSALVPKPGQRAPVVVKAQPNIIRPGTVDKVAAEVSQSETVINVTIGRIEVRATPAQQSRPERQRAAPTVMSLDDYLRKRSGGKS
jgi:hypothetical protein